MLTPAVALRAALLPLIATALSCSHPAVTPSGEHSESQPPDDKVTIKPESRPFIKVEQVSAHRSAAIIDAPARINFREGALSQVGAPVSGRVTQVHARPGDEVAKGAPLATLSCPDAASVRTSRATTAAALREAKVSFERQRRMLEQGVSTEREKLEAETKLAQAIAEHQRALASVALIGEGPGATVVLRSPISGTVIAWKATVGTVVQAGGEPLVEIGNPDALWVVADVFERDLAQIRVGTLARVEVSASREPLLGKVVSVGAVITSLMRTAPVRIVVDKKNVPLRAGMYGRAAIESTERGVTLPAAAVLIRNGKETVVYVEKDRTTFVRRGVVVTEPHHGMVRVLSGVSPGDRVVTVGALLLDGAAEQLL